MDLREGGGDHISLSTFAVLLKKENVSFYTKTLPIGDYQFQINFQNETRTLNFIFERKKAFSIYLTV